MQLIKELELGHSDAENYKRRENKELLNKLFIKDDHLDKLCDHGISFLVGEKGTGKTAYSIFLSNNNYKNTLSSISYVRETEYQKFIAIKKQKNLDLSDYASVWKVILYLLISKQVLSKENAISKLLNYNKFDALNSAIDEYYNNAFAPEISQALSLLQESSLAAQLMSKYAQASGTEKEVRNFTESRFQINLFYIQKKFEEGLSQIRLSSNHILFIDGIDIRPASLSYEDYLECIKGLANAIWEINNDFFPTIKGGGGRMRAVLLIRPDIFQSLSLQNQNTKIRNNSVFLDWRTEYYNHRKSMLFEVVDHMLKTQQDSDKKDVLEKGDTWDYYFPWDSPNLTSTYDKPSSFINFLRWSYYRPRDILTLLDLLKGSCRNAPGKKTFSLSDFENPAFQREYSEYLLGEIKDHLSFYYDANDYETFLKFFEFLSGSDKFTYAEFQTAYSKLTEYIASTSNETPAFMKSANEYLQFLFDLNVICYIEVSEDNKPFIHWCFRDRSYANISPKVKIEVKYEIFYGLAKALNVGKKFK